MKYCCAFCDFEHYDFYILARHWDECKGRLKFNVGEKNERPKKD